MPPRRTAERLAALVTGEWGTGLIGSWATWLDMPQRVGDRLAPLIGARPGEVVVHDSTTSTSTSWSTPGWRCVRIGR